MSEKVKHSEIDEVPDKIDLCGIAGRLNKQMTLNTHGKQSESEMSNETHVEPSNEE